MNSTIVRLFLGPAAAVLLLGVGPSSSANAIEEFETNGAFFAISVENLDKAVSWYATHLGFTLVSQGRNAQRKGALLVRSDAILEIAEFSGAMPRSSLKDGIEPQELFGIFKIGFIVSDLDRTYERLVAKRVEVFFPIVTASDGRRTFGVKDSEGNIIQFFGE